MVLRLVTGFFGAFMLVSTVPLASGHASFTRQLADGRVVAVRPTLIERLSFALLQGTFGVWLLAYALLPVRDRVAIELYAGAGIALVFAILGLVIVLAGPSDREALARGTVVEAAPDDSTTLEIPTPSDAVAGFVDRLIPADWARGRAVFGALVVATISVLILAGLMPSGVVAWFEDVDATINAIDMAVTAAVLGLIVLGCALALLVGILSFNGGLAGGAAVGLLILGVLLGLGALVGATQELWEAARDVVS